MSAKKYPRPTPGEYESTFAPTRYAMRDFMSTFEKRGAMRDFMRRSIYSNDHRLTPVTSLPLREFATARASAPVVQKSARLFRDD